VLGFSNTYYGIKEKMKKRNDATIAYYKCPECKKVLSVPRQIGRRRERGHKKDLWCPFCKAERTFVEMDIY
jgi:transposase-like protein